MENTVLTKSFPPPEIQRKEIKRYLGVKESDQKIEDLIEEVITKTQNSFTYSVCFLELPVKLEANTVTLGDLELVSQALAKNLKGCQRAIIFGATVGIGVDKLIAKYSRLSPSRAVVIDAFATERIESLCDEFCLDLSQNLKLRPRFSAGYGDLKLECQRDIIAMLDCQRRIGLTLNESLLMSPSKSVTAIVGIEKRGF